MWNILSSKPAREILYEGQDVTIFPGAASGETIKPYTPSIQSSVRREVRQIEARLHKGEKACHKVRSGRVAWVQLMSGYAEVNDEILSAGDGVSFSSGRSVVIRALDSLDLVIFDMAQED